MSRASLTQTAAEPANASAAGGMLQRKCAYASEARPLGGECEEWRQEGLPGVQTKLLIGAGDDPLEQEADRVAEQVLGMPAPADAPGPSAASGDARRAALAESRYAHDFQQISVRARGRGAAAQTSAEALPEPADLMHGGSPLPPTLRGFYEPRFRRDLSEVRVHTGPRAELWNDHLNAHAFTYGSHIWLGRGHRPAAGFLLAHELAHVIQQRQPEPLPDRALADEPAATPALAGSPPVVRRLELGLPFWVPLGAKGKKTGSDIHSEVLAFAQANNKDLDVEAPAPNANAKDWGLGLQGSIDLYQGKNADGFHAQVGLFFDGTTGAQNADVLAATPEKHRRAAKAGIAAGKFNPFVTAGGGIDGIDKGPTEVKIGELKPAAKPILDKGTRQIANYKAGIKDAARLTNAWASVHSVTEQWTLNSTDTLPDAAVAFKQGGKDLKFNPSSPRDDQTLVLATVSEGGIGGKYRFKVRFNPAEHDLPPIKGGLYAQIFRSGKGLWTYFARPKDLTAALDLARSALIKGEMTLANQVQDQIIDPLLQAPKKKAPQKVAPLRRNRRAAAARSRQAPTPLSVSRSPRLVRRAPKKAPELKDEFKFGDWNKAHTALREKISGPKASKETKKKVASLELLERAYEAEEALDKVPGTGKTTLPPKGSDVVRIVTGSGAEQKVRTRKLADLASWLKGWTGLPAVVLGRFRDIFGDSFVWVANKLVDLRSSIRSKFRAAFEEHPSKPTAGKAKIIAKALLKGLLQVAKVLIPRALHLFMDAVVAGSKKKLATVFDLDPVKMGEAAFGKEFKVWNNKLVGFKGDAEDYVSTIANDYTKNLGWIQEVLDKSKIIGPILEAASIAIQCGKKPGWNCLLLLSKRFRECGMEMALNICAVQKQIAGVVAAVGPIANLPATLAEKSLEVVKGAAPEGLKDIFSEPVAKSGPFNSDDIDCEHTPPETTCPGLIPLPLPGGVPLPGDKEEKSEQREKGPAKEQKETPEAEKQEAPPQPGEAAKGRQGPGKTGEPSGAPETAGRPGEKQQARPGGKGAEEGKAGDEAAGGDKDVANKGEEKTDETGKGGVKAEPPAGEKPAPGEAKGSKTGKGAPAQPGGELPAPEEVHKALNDLLNEHGPEGLGALAGLAEAAGMPGDEPLTAKQVRELQDLLKKGKLSVEDLQKLAGGQAKPKVKKRARPLEKFLETEAHGAVLEQTLEKLRQKRYEFKFEEMAKHKVHWKILMPYRPGPFRNAPALMWDEHIRAAGVVDGEYGKCYDDGKIPLTITKADMREEGTERKLTVHTPFHDRDAQLTGGVCPAPPAPKGGGAGEGDGGAGRGKGRVGDGGQGEGAGKAKGDEAAKAPPQGRRAAAGEVDSDVKPGSKGDPMPGGGGPKEQDEGRQEAKDKAKGAPEEAKEEDKRPKFPLNTAALGSACGLPPPCAVEPWLVDFEELGGLNDGWQAMPDKTKDPDATQSMVNPPNKLSPFSLRTADDGSREIVMSCAGKTCVVGKVKPSPLNVGMVELVSGPLLDTLKSAVREFIKAKRSGDRGRAERFHFF